MARFKKIIIVFMLVTWPLLLAWSFQSVRLWTAQSVFWHLGFGVPPGSTDTPAQEFIAMRAFKPRTLMKPVSSTIPEKPKFDTIEIHGHTFRHTGENFEQDMDKLRIKYFINLAARTATLADYKKIRAKFPSERVLHFPTFNWKRVAETDDFGQAMARDLEEMARAGAKGVKLWKNYGLIVRDRNKKLVTLDDPRLDPVWDVCAKYKMVIAIHTADPLPFFYPIDSRNERFGELARRPGWSFHGADLPSFDEVMAQRDRLFAKRRDVRFIAVHFGEFAHDLKRAEKLLEDHPNVWLDTAQRIDELGRQPRAARAFFLKYQDRIMFGMDGQPDMGKARIYWRFLETTDEYFDYHPPHKPRKGFWKIHGLGLPDAVLKKIYYTNGARLLGLPAK